ncbi:type IV toxin-antitoxin system AbiEi family antitoxin domain-containing protein [Streptomyces fructofermentans]|uniref:type IV toxin-antitoxin system AbiEi family antitoxin domain-containing protein n=1 Tax=Streptomyces fructofermentans TaxID=152141 RepID=UPI0033C2FA46
MDRTEQLTTLSGPAADQWGLVTATQAKRLGLSGVQLLRLTEADLLESVGHGVYALPAAGIPPHLEIKIAWLRLEPQAFAWERAIDSPDSGVVSHASACQLHALGDIPASDAEISVPRRRTTIVPSVRLRTAALKPADITVIDGLPVTTATRTIVDLLRARADGGHVGGVIADAEHRDLVDIDLLADRVQPAAARYGLGTAATGHELIEHLVNQAGRSLHSQDVIVAHQMGGLVALADLLEASQAAAGAPSSLGTPRSIDALSAFLSQHHGISSALRNAVPQLRETSALLDAARSLRETPGFRDPHPSLRQTATTPGVQAAILAMRKAATLSPGAQHALRQAALPNAAVRKAVEALQQLNADTTDTGGAAEEAVTRTGEPPHKGQP